MGRAQRRIDHGIADDLQTAARARRNQRDKELLRRQTLIWGHRSAGESLIRSRLIAWESLIRMRLIAGESLVWSWLIAGESLIRM